MKKELYLFITATAISVIYGIFCIYTMLIENRSPYTIVCDGVLLDKTKVYAISNNIKTSADTIYLNFKQSEVIMPTTLGFIYFDNKNNQFVLKNDQRVTNSIIGVSDNPYLPFCRTLHDGYFHNGNYFGPNEIISEKVLLTRGIKYNVAAGTKENRISLEFNKTDHGIVLTIKDDGIKTKYLIQNRTENKFEVFFNRSIENTTCKNIFQFTNTSHDTNFYTISVIPELFNASYTIKDDKNKTIKKNTGQFLRFYLNNFQFSINPKFSRFFTIALLTSYIILIFFQIYLLSKLNKAKSPLIRALYGFRLSLNCLAFLAIPLFLTSIYMVDGRGWYLILLIILNISIFFPKDLFNRTRYKFSPKIISYLSIVVLVISPIVFKIATFNENLFGIIPILHCQKALLLLLIYTTQNSFFYENKRRYFLRVTIIIGYSLIISVLTSDIGSFIYSGLAIILVELIRKSVGLKLVFGSLAIIALTIILLFTISPSTFSHDRKTYRIVAPYITPESDILELANQEDRESYSSLNLNLKNIINLDEPRFNDLIIPSSMRSTLHSDFAFHWSFSFGGWIFFLLYVIINFLLLSRLLLLLYCSIRSFKVRKEECFIFPNSRNAELVRFLIAFTIIGFTYPIASNLLLIPLTGQSIPCLSVSNVEIIFLIILVSSLENIFNNPKHYVVMKNTYTFGDVGKSINWGLFMVTFLFSISLFIRLTDLYLAPEKLTWKKYISNESIELEGKIPDKNDKKSLIDFAKKIIDRDKLTAVDKTKKPILKNLASIYFTNKRYTESVHEPTTFSNSTIKMINQMSIDSFFSDNRKIISGPFHPYGKVYSMRQKVNNQSKHNVSHLFYKCVPLDATSINTDLTAECNDNLQRHLALINTAGNIGSIVIVDNRNGGIKANSTFPLDSVINSNEIHYLIGSLKKTLLAYCALTIDKNYMLKKYGGRTFEDFIKYSDDFYAASLLKELLTNQKDAFDKILRSDFNLPLYSVTNDSYLDFIPTNNDFSKPLNRNNTIYRQAIGQQRPYKFHDAIEWYVRIGSKKKLTLNYDTTTKECPSLSIGISEYDYLKKTLNSVLDGTAKNVGISFRKHGIKSEKFFCKTGTSEKADKTGNSSSSFIIVSDNYTIGVMIKGNLPHNSTKLAAKDLFTKLIPTLKKYRVL